MMEREELGKIKHFTDMKSVMKMVENIVQKGGFERIS
jgi:hypothetical protein